ncbi:MAG: YqaJ viral recombinase family protein [Ruminococcus sp.]
MDNYSFDSILADYKAKKITLKELIDIVCSHLTDNYKPKVYKNTAKMTTEEWEEARRDSIGGSDQATVLGVEAYGRTKRGLYYDKKGIVPVNPPKQSPEINFDSGHFLEQLVADVFATVTGLCPYEIKAMFEHPLFPHIRVNIDRFLRYKGKPNPMGILECKTTHEFNNSWDEEGVPFHYYLQVQTYLSALNMHTGYIACLFVPTQAKYMAATFYKLSKAFEKFPAELANDVCDCMLSLAKTDSELEPYIKMFLHMMIGEYYIPRDMLKDFTKELSKKFVYKKIERDRELEKEILSKDIDFWYSYIEANRLPPLTESGEACADLLEAYLPKKCNGIRINATKEMEDNIEAIKALEEQHKLFKATADEIEKAKKDLYTPFIEALDGNSSGIVVLSDGKEISVSNTSRTSRSTQYKVLEEGYPEAYKAAVRLSTSKPSFKLNGI